MKFRISMKNDSKHDSAKPVQVSIPQKDAIAIEPPKKVIKALFDFASPADTNMYLSFSAGDFLHVVSRENDKDWYEACNPLRGERGLVPVKYFETVGKTVRDSGDSSKSATSAPHDSGYAESAATTTTQASSSSRAPTAVSANGQPAMTPAHAHRPSKSLGGAGVYGIVMYDFKPERPDELEAHEGEAIIVIAQSNPEWFVAKPITRLGGPGLIPVSFIEVRDMATGKPAKDPSEAVAKAGIPTVEEWKRMAADYKNTSIPLGTVSSSQQAQNVQQSMERMSLSNGQQNGGYGHARQSSSAVHAQQQPPSQHPQQQQSQQQRNLFAPVRASVPRYVFADDKFHFIVECRLSNGTHWDLSRIYEDFYELQINLKKAFPEEAGDVQGKPRTLPFVPGPVQFVTDNISEGRRYSLDSYLRDLLKLGQHISSSTLVRNFFAPRPGDYEIDPNSVDLNEHARAAEGDVRYSQTSQASHSNPTYYQQQGRQPSNAPGQHQYTPSQASNAPSGHSRAQPSQTSNNFSAPPGAHNLQPPPVSRQTTNTTLASNSSGGPLPGPGAQYPVKLKAWFDRDTCVVIRMPPHGQFTFADLYRKIVERRHLEFRSSAASQAASQQNGGNGEPDDNPTLDIEYRDEADGEYYRLEDDDDMNGALHNALRRAEERSALGQERAIKLTLAVRPLQAES